ncbi:hypothetical protein BAME_14320 [Bacillus sp. M 2-6]|uniref:hypothetical protein n=1 Tax=Bacillus sp. M 2-6 TaxID=1177926 RepID=UPI000260AB91|nr:hypothetical protein [Bacillus sp. M 2-6]EIL85409.1 hypothetical protein BAME_14320 [Bacillus sp. M 2-6]
MNYFDAPFVQDEMRRPFGFGRPGFGFGRPGFGFGRPGFGYGRPGFFGPPFLGGFAGGLLAGSLLAPGYGYGYPYPPPSPPYGPYPYY